MIATVPQLALARDYFARAPARGVLTEVARRYRTSRPTAYRIVERVADAIRQGGAVNPLRRLRKQLAEAERRLEDAHQEIGDLQDRLKPDWRRIRRFIVQAAVSPVSLRDTCALVREAFRVEVSHEYVRTVVDAASIRARELFDRLAPAQHARRAVGDEIFLGDSPMLVVAEPHSLAVLAVAVEEHRDEKTWTKAFEALGELEIFASDLGKGLTAAVEARGWLHQADIFHALKILTESLSVEERRAYATIEEEYAWERRLEQLRDAGEDLRGVATNHALAHKKTQGALDRFDEIEKLVRRLRSAVHLCDEFGRWMSPEERERRIGPALDRLDALGLARRRRVAGYWRNPKLLSFAREVQRRLDALEVPPCDLDRRDLLDAASGAWARAAALLHGPGALVAVLRRQTAARSCADFGSLLAGVAAILNDALRASSAIECLNSLWRVYQQVKKSFGTDFAYLVALHHNLHVFTEGPRRRRTPFELLGVDAGTRDWLSLVV